jgi:ATP-dependent Clp protease ATP-binding subunit ClpB
MELELTPTARTYIAEAAYDPLYGARPLKRYLQHELETPLARAVIGGAVRDGWRIRVDMSLVDSPDTDAPLRFGHVLENGRVEWVEVS